MSGLATYISDSSNIGCFGILTFIYMLNAQHIFFFSYRIRKHHSPFQQEAFFEYQISIFLKDRMILRSNGLTIAGRF